MMMESTDCMIQSCLEDLPDGVHVHLCNDIMVI
jgi:hypothetical protein